MDPFEFATDVIHDVTTSIGLREDAPGIGFDFEMGRDRVRAVEREDFGEKALRRAEVRQGVVLARDVLSGLANDEFETQLAMLAKPLHFVSEKLPGHVLLKTFLKS